MHYVPFPSDSFLSHLVAVELLRAHPVLPLSSHESSALSLSSEFVFYKIQFNFLQNLKNYELQNPRDGRSSEVISPSARNHSAFIQRSSPLLTERAGL